MAAPDLNVLDPATKPVSATAGDVPETVRRRYLSERQAGPAVAYYVDARVETPAFRDHGRRLATEGNDPTVIRDLVAIARHRGWSVVAVRGETGFRREAWRAARAAGLDVRGYRPTERDLQALSRGESNAAARPAAQRSHQRPSAAEARLRIVETVVRDRIAEPATQAAVLAAARARIAGWLERGATFDLPARRRSADRAR